MSVEMVETGRVPLSAEPYQHLFYLCTSLVHIDVAAAIPENSQEMCSR